MASLMESIFSHLSFGQKRTLSVINFITQLFRRSSQRNKNIKRWTSSVQMQIQVQAMQNMGYCICQQSRSIFCSRKRDRSAKLYADCERWLMASMFFFPNACRYSVIENAYLLISYTWGLKLSFKQILDNVKRIHNHF